MCEDISLVFNPSLETRGIILRKFMFQIIYGQKFFLSPAFVKTEVICINSFLSHEESFQKLVLALGKPDPEPTLFLGRRTSLASPTLRLARKILMKSILLYRQHSRTRPSRRPTATPPSSSTSASPCCPGVRRVATRYSHSL